MYIQYNIYSQNITKMDNIYNTSVTEYKILGHYPDVIDSTLTIDFYIKDTSYIDINIFQGYYNIKHINIYDTLTIGYYSISISLRNLVQGDYEYKFDIYNNINKVFTASNKIYKGYTTKPTYPTKLNTQINDSNKSVYTYNKPSFGIGFGVSIANTASNQFGMTVSSIMGNFFWDISLNGATGDGEYLEFKSSKTYQKKNTVSWIATNIGFIINIQDNVNIIPTIGYVIKQNIYNDPVGWNTWYKENNNSNASIGAMLLIKNPSFFIIAGINTFEVCKLAVGFIL